MPPVLFHVTVNVCHGVQVLAQALSRTNGDVTRALLRYNGCVGAVSGCWGYPNLVFSRLGRTTLPTWAE